MKKEKKYNRKKIANENMIDKRNNDTVYEEDFLDIIINLMIKNKRNLLKFLIISLTLIIISLIIYISISKKISNLNKKPICIKSYDILPNQVFNNIFIYSNNTKELQIYDKSEGKFIEKVVFPDVIKRVTQNSKGEIFVIIHNHDILYKYFDKNITSIMIPGLKNATCIINDSEDNFIISFADTCSIVKYNNNFEKVKEFGGRGTQKGKFNAISKIYRDIKDNIYAIDVNPFCIKIFDKEGNFIREIKLSFIEYSPPTELVIPHDGKIYVNDLKNWQIVVINNKGKLLTRFKSDITGNFPVGSPGCFSGGLDNLIYVNRFVYEPIRY